NLQTAFALLSLAASVVNKKNQKTDAATERHQTCLNGRGARRKAKPNFRRMLAHPQATGGPNLRLLVGLGFSGAGALG
ncbi:hypothetical protein, partial [uncultured Rikenella sp.]|uniref:hypothetical protein n=1 Tax=uncultured Rikenella sp. TaxID=368003 RepID=UPI00272CC7C9